MHSMGGILQAWAPWEAQLMLQLALSAGQQAHLPMPAQVPLPSLSLEGQLLPPQGPLGLLVRAQLQPQQLQQQRQQ